MAIGYQVESADVKHARYGRLSRKQRSWAGILLVISALPGAFVVASDPSGVYTPTFALLALQLLAAGFAFGRPRIALSLLLPAIALQLLTLLWGSKGHIYSNGSALDFTAGFLLFDFGLPVTALIIMLRGTSPFFGELRFDTPLKLAVPISMAWAALTTGPALIVDFEATASGSVNKHVNGSLFCCTPWSHVVHAPDPLLLWIGALAGPALILMAAFRTGGRARTTAWVGTSIFMVGVSLLPLSQLGAGSFFKHTKLGSSSIDLTMETSLSAWGWTALGLAGATVLLATIFAFRSLQELDFLSPDSMYSGVGSEDKNFSATATSESTATAASRLAALNGVVLVEVCDYYKATRFRDRRRGSLVVDGDSITYVHSSTTIASWSIREISQFRSCELPSGRVEIIIQTTDSANAVFTSSDVRGIAVQVCNEFALEIIPNLNQTSS